MRGDMQVRFGGRYGKTYCRKAVRRSVPSLRLGKGGGIIELAAHLYATDHVPYILKRIAEQAPHVRPVSFSFGKQNSSEPSFQQLEIVPLSSPALLAYLQGRGINMELAKRECSEARFTHNGKRYFAIAFPNGLGGFEVRNRYFKGCIAPKEISHIRQSGKARNICYVFEGFMDYLSFLTLRQESCPNYPELDGQDYIVLNSVSNVNKALYPLGSYERIHCFFDNDHAGMEALRQIRKEYGRDLYIRDASQTYSGCKDLNEYLQKQVEKKKYYVVRERAVPEVLLKVVEAKRLLESKRVATVQEAAERTGISRSSFYKYKDDIFPFHEETKGKTITFIIQMDDEPGLLSMVLQTIARFHGNILTIHQSIPINGVATLTLSVDILPGEGDAEAMVEDIEQRDGIHYLKILGRE